MESVKLNKKDLRERYGSEIKLGELVDHLGREAQRDKKVIGRVVLDGVKLTERDEASLSEKNLTDIESLELFYLPQLSLVEKTVETAREYIERTHEHSLLISEKLRQGMTPELGLSFVELINDLKLVTEALSVLKPSLLDDHEDGTKIGKWQEVENKTSEAVKEMILAFEAQDYIMVSDVLEYELLGCLEDWAILLSIPRPS